MSKFYSVLIVIAAIVVIGVLGCNTLVDKLTPADINKRAIDYAKIDVSGELYPNLLEARRIKDEVILKHRDTQLDLKRLAEDDQITYADALAFMNNSINDAESLQALLVGDASQPLSILGLLAPLGIGTLLGQRFLKRPGDKSPAEVAILTNGNGTTGA